MSYVEFERVETAKEMALRRFYLNRWDAHQLLFRHRHPDPSPPAHKALVEHIYSDHPHLLTEGFRGFAKSTYLEETAILRALYREFHNMVIVGASYARAVERLEAIKRELDHNEELEALFGSQRGSTWREGKIILANGVCIQGVGRDQAMTGMKYLDWRPDAALVDDVEDPEEVRTDADRQKTWGWFIKVFLPALDNPETTWVRVTGTRRGNGSLPQRLEEDVGWPTVKFPVEYIDEAGQRRATWPAPNKFPLDRIDRLKESYRGDMHTWMQEYMCVATSEADRVFTREMFRVEPRERSWQAVYAMIDPARTTNRTSATTGWAVWSWLGARLVVWAAGAAFLKPDEIIDLIFTVAAEFNPVTIGVEEDGLNEFILQPLRHEQARRGITIPVRAVRAPRGKLDFIRGLQPFFSAREVVFHAPLPELEAQLLSFPTGRIDAPNALAYALQMRPAAPIYDGFSADSIADELEPDPARPLYLAANATGSTTTAILCQQLGEQLRIYADWVVEGTPFETVAQIGAEAGAAGDAALVKGSASRYDWREALRLPAARPEYRRQAPRWVVPPHHGNEWNNVGLEQAIRRLPATLSRGAREENGRNQIQRLLGAMAHGHPRVLVGAGAQWTLRAFAGGYTRSLRKGGQLSDHAEEGAYRTLMEGLESFAGMSAALAPEDGDEDAQPLATNRHGMTYRSALPQRR